MARAAARDPRLRLLLVGPVPDPGRLEADLDRIGVRPLTVVTGRVPLADLATHIEAADVVAHLRYPTARETSAALLRVLAQGRATVVSDLEHQADLPRGRGGPGGRHGRRGRADPRDPAPGRRPRRPAPGSGRRPAAHVRQAHAPSRVRDAWEDALERARRLPNPPVPGLAGPLAAPTG